MRAVLHLIPGVQRSETARFDLKTPPTISFGASIARCQLFPFHFQRFPIQSAFSVSIPGVSDPGARVPNRFQRCTARASRDRGLKHPFTPDSCAIARGTWTSGARRLFTSPPYVEGGDAHWCS